MTAPNIANIAALIADPARAAILDALLDGRAWTATELSLEAGVTPQTTSSHLGKLLDGGMIVVARQGRHRYYRLAGPEVAHILETLAVVAGGRKAPRSASQAEAAKLRAARTCYDHLAGQLGVGLVRAMVAKGVLEPETEDFAVTQKGEAFLRELGLDLDAARAKRRAFARQCIDWSEREPHLGGALGAALAERCFAAGWLKRVRNTRRVEVTPAGARELETRFALGRHVHLEQPAE
jgi:DNA-binding transcriptional ArsR family regulator